LPKSGYLAAGEYQIKASYNEAAKNYTISKNSKYGKVTVAKAELLVDETAINLYYKETEVQTLSIELDRITLVDGKPVIKYALVGADDGEPLETAYTETEPSGKFEVGTYLLYYTVDAANHEQAAGYIVVTVEATVYELVFDAEITTTYGQTVLTQAELLTKIKSGTYSWTANGEVASEDDVAALERAISLTLEDSKGKVYNSGDLIPVGTYTIKIHGTLGGCTIAFADSCNINKYEVTKLTVTVNVESKTITYGDWTIADIEAELKNLLTVENDFVGSTLGITLSLDAELPADETAYLAAYKSGYQIVGKIADTANYTVNATYGKVIVNPAKIVVDKSAITLYASSELQTLKISDNRLTLVGNAATKIRYALVDSTAKEPAEGDYSLVAPSKVFGNAGSYKLYYIIEAANHETATGSIDVTVDGEVVYELSFSGKITTTYGDKVLTKEELLEMIQKLDYEWTASGQKVEDKATIEALFNSVTFSVVDSDGNEKKAGSIIDAGTYTIKVTGTYDVEDINYKVTFADYCNLNAYVVNRLEVTVTLNDVKIHYGDWANADVDEELQNLLIKNVSGDFLGSDLQITLALDVTSLPDSGYLAVGTYKIKATYNTAAKNYTVSEDSVFGNIIVEKAEIQVDESAINLYYIKDKVQTVSIGLGRLTLVDKENTKVVIKYALVGEGEEPGAYTETQPSRVFEMGNYKLYYIIEAANHETATGSIDVIVEGRVYEIEFTGSVNGGKYGDKVPSQADILSAIEALGAKWYENGVEVTNNTALVNAIKAAITISIVDSEGNEYHSGNLIPVGTYTIKITGSFNYNTKDPELLAPITFVGACNVNAFKVAQREVTVTLNLPAYITYGDWENANVGAELKNLLTISGDFAGSTLAIELSLDHNLPESGYLAAYEKGYQVIGTANDTVNYKIVIANGTYGTLVVKKADMHVDKAEIITLNADKDEAQTVGISENRITLVGEEYNRSSVTVRYALVEEIGGQANKPDDSVFTSNRLSHVFNKQAKYRLYFIVEADNHNRADGYILIDVKEGAALYEISFTGKINKTFGDGLLSGGDLLAALKALTGFKWLQDGEEVKDSERIEALESAIKLTVVDSEGRAVSGTLNAGTYTVKVEGTYDHDAYHDPITFADGCNINVYVVAQRKVTVTVSDATVEYGQLTKAGVAAKLAELANDAIAGDYEGSNLRITLAIDGNLPDSTYVAVGTYALKGTSNDTNKNYVIKWQLGSLSVTPATVEGAEVTGYTGVYDGASHDVVVSKKATTVGGAELLWTYSLDGTKWVESLKALDVTNGTVTVAFKAVDVNGNHYDANGSFTYEVTPLEVKITLPETKEVTYGEDYWTETDLAAAIEALTDELEVKDINGKALPDAVSQVITLTLQGTMFSSGGYLKVGTYAIVINTAEGVGSKAHNYKVSEAVSGSLIITQRKVSVNGIGAESRIYDRTTNVNFVTNNATIDGLAEGDSLDLFVSGAFESANAGKYNVAIEIKLTGSDASNYVLDESNSQKQVQNVEIWTIKLSVTWNLEALTTTDKGLTHYYNGKAPEIYAVLNTENVLEGDSVRLGKTVGLSGEKGPHEAYYLLEGSDAVNYEIVDGSVEYTVIYMTITIEFKDDIVATYGEDAQLKSNSAKLTGWTVTDQNGDKFDLIGEGLPTVSVKFKVLFEAGDVVNGFAKVGRYKIVLDESCNIAEYYEIANEVIGWFVVEAADVLVTRTSLYISPVKATKVGLETSDIVLQGAGNDVQVEYELVTGEGEATGTYGSEKPEVTADGTYRLYYRITAANHNVKTGYITVIVKDELYVIELDGKLTETYGYNFTDGVTLLNAFKVKAITREGQPVEQGTWQTILSNITAVSVTGIDGELKAGKPNAGTYSLTVTAGEYDGARIVLANGNGAFVVTKKVGTVNWNLSGIQDKTYTKKFNNAAIETLPVVSGLEAGEYEIRYAKGGLTVSASEYGLHVGEYVVTIIVDTKNYTVEDDTLTVIVSALSLTVTIDEQSATYGDWSNSNVANKIKALIKSSGDTLPEDIDLYSLFTITLKNANYSNSGYLLASDVAYEFVAELHTEDITIEFKLGALKVGKQTITLAGTETITAAEKYYDGTTNVTLDTSKVTVSGKVEGDDVSFSFAGEFEDKNAAKSVKVNVTITLDGADKDNYSFTAPELPELSAEIKQIELIVYWNTDNLTQPDGKWTHVYSGYQPDISAEIANADKIAAGEAGSVRITAVKCDETATDVRAEGYRFYVTLESTAESVNYFITGTEITVYIVEATIEVNFQNITMYESGEAQTVSLNAADIVLKGINNTATITYVVNTSETDPADGEYKTTESVTNVGTYYLHYKIEAANHTTLYGHVTVTVKAAELVITVGTITKTYGVKAPTSDELKAELTITSADFDGNDITDTAGIIGKITSVSLKGATIGSILNAGSYDIEIAADRYEFMGYKLKIVFTNGEGAYVIEKKVVDINWHLDDNEKVTMGQEGNYSAEYGVTFTEPTITTGVVGGTQCLLAVRYIRNGVDAKSDYLGARPNAGVYTLTVVEKNDPNYALPENYEVTVEVTKIDLLITIGNATAEYNRYATGSLLNAQIGRLVTLRGDLDKVLSGEDINEIVIVSVDVGTGKLNAGKYAIVGIQLGGGYADNYNVTFTGTWNGAGAYLGKAGVFEVTPLIITVTGVTAEDKDYDGTVNVTFNYSAMVVNGVVQGDTVTATAVGQFADRHAGKEKLVEVIRYELAGADAGNYVVDMDHSTYELTAEIRSLEMPNPTPNPDIPKDEEGNTDYDPDLTLDDIINGYKPGMQDVCLTTKEGGHIHITTDDNGNIVMVIDSPVWDGIEGGTGKISSTTVTTPEGKLLSVTTRTRDDEGNCITHITDYTGSEKGETTQIVELPERKPTKPGESKTTITTTPDGKATVETESIVRNDDRSITNSYVKTDSDGNKYSNIEVKYTDGTTTETTVQTDKDGNMITSHKDKDGDRTTIYTDSNANVVNEKVVDQYGKFGKIEWNTDKTEGTIKDSNGKVIGSVKIEKGLARSVNYTVTITDGDNRSSSAETDGNGNFKSDATDENGKSKGTVESNTDSKGNTETEVKDGDGDTVTDVTDGTDNKGNHETEVKDGNGKTTGSATTGKDDEGNTNSTVTDSKNKSTDMNTSQPDENGVGSTVTDPAGNQSNTSTKKDENGNIDSSVTDKDGNSTGADIVQDEETGKGGVAPHPGDYEIEVKPKDEGDASFEDSDKDNSFDLKIEKKKLKVPVKSLFADNLTPEQLNSIFIAQGNTGTYIISPEHIAEIIMNYDAKTMAYTAVLVNGEYIVSVRLINTSKYVWEDGTSDPLTFKFAVEVPDVPTPSNPGAGFNLDTNTLLVIAIVVILLIFIIAMIRMSRKNKKALEEALKAASENNANIYYGDYYEGGYDDTGFDDYYEGDDWEDFTE
ncbi:MAG: hypothetical protein J1G07_06320, partial [Clostridiales bacterium]|nr:hypothetical protein [Clostridiales bacterium]